MNLLKIYIKIIDCKKVSTIKVKKKKNPLYSGYSNSKLDIERFCIPRFTAMRKEQFC